MGNILEIINLDESEYKYSERHGTYGGQAGMKDGIIYNDENWIVKYPKTTKDMNVEGMSYTTSSLSEFIGNNIYRILGYKVHETRLALKNNKLVVMCKDFRADDEMLLEIRTIKNAVNRELAETLDRDFSETGSRHLVNLEELLIHMEQNDILKNIKDLKETFWDCVVIDILINNNDRNNGNWGILRKRGVPDRMAPIFDNGSSFSNKTNDIKISKYLSSHENLAASALNTVTIFQIDGKQLTTKKMLQLDNQYLKEAILRTVPKIYEAQSKIYEFIMAIPETYNGIYVCSKVRAEYYLQSMLCRLDNFLKPAYERYL